LDSLAEHEEAFVRNVRGLCSTHSLGLWRNALGRRPPAGGARWRHGSVPGRRLQRCASWRAPCSQFAWPVAVTPDWDVIAMTARPPPAAKRRGAVSFIAPVGAHSVSRLAGRRGAWSRSQGADAGPVRTRVRLSNKRLKLTARRSGAVRPLLPGGRGGCSSRAAAGRGIVGTRAGGSLAAIRWAAERSRKKLSFGFSPNAAARTRCASAATLSGVGRRPAGLGWRHGSSPGQRAQRCASLRVPCPQGARPVTVTSDWRVVAISVRPPPAAKRAGAVSSGSRAGGHNVSRRSGRRGAWSRAPVADARPVSHAGLPNKRLQLSAARFGGRAAFGCSAAAAARACIGGGRGGILGAARGGRS
jgi:hypothetical protein